MSTPVGDIIRTGRIGQIFSFPDPVNEVSARVVAAGVVVLAIATLVTRQPLILVVVAYGFLARVLTGPTMSPLGQLSTKVVTPRLHVEPKFVPGPPKRFAQTMGLVMSTTAAVLALGFGERAAGFVITGLIVVAATLESAFGYCIGCKAFGLLMRLGVIPEEVCERCNDIYAGRPQAA